MEGAVVGGARGRTLGVFRRPSLQCRKKPGKEAGHLKGYCSAECRSLGPALKEAPAEDESGNHKVVRDRLTREVRVCTSGCAAGPGTSLIPWRLASPALSCRA